MSLLRTKGEDATVTVEARFDPPMDLGLDIAPIGIVDQLFGDTAQVIRLFQSDDIKTGYPPFDEAYSVRGDDPERADRLFWGEASFLPGETPESEPTGLVGKLHGLGASLLRVRDDCLVVQARGEAEKDLTYDERPLREWVQRVARAANTVEYVRRLVPPLAAVRRLLPAWRELCAERGLSLVEGAPTVIRGRLDSTTVWARTCRPAEHGDVEVGAAFDTPLDFSLDVRPATKGLPALLEAADLAVGDAAFDGAFRVASSDRERALEVLDAETRARLLSLAEGRRLELGLRGLTVRAHAAALAPHDIRTLLEHVAEVVAAIAWKARMRTSRGYR